MPTTMSAATGSSVQNSHFHLQGGPKGKPLELFMSTYLFDTKIVDTDSDSIETPLYFALCLNRAQTGMIG